MNKFTLLISLFFATVLLLFTNCANNSQDVRPVKNLIVLIPDGASPAVYSAARWLNHFNGLGHQLHVDPFLTGTVSTFSSNAPIADSAPAGSAFSAGIVSETGNVAIHPIATPNDIFPELIDASRANQPAATILEAARIKRGMAVGMVVTCEFTHATPASFASHHYSRSANRDIAKQIAFNNLDVLFGGGTSLVSDAMREHFRNTGTTLIENDRAALLNYTGNRVWALFGNMAMPNDIDKDRELVPSLAEMTTKAIDILSRNRNGFFLMVEGSQVDWAAHANDPVATLTDFLAFDKAVGVAMDFAKRCGNTAVVVVSDHGTGGFSIGSARSPSYHTLSLEGIFGTLSQIRRTSNGMANILRNTEPEDFGTVFRYYTNIELNETEINSLLASRDFREGTHFPEHNNRNLNANVVRIFNSHTCFGWTTGGHTGEEMLLASFHPQDHVLRGHLKSTQVNTYFQQVLGLRTSLTDLTDQIFVLYSDVFGGMDVAIDRANPQIPTLTIRNGQNTMTLTAFSSVGVLNGNSFDVGSVVVYIGRSGEFYLPKKLREKL